MIDFEDFKKIDLRVGKVLEVERIEESDKLLKLRVDLGEETRQIIAGLAKSYDADDLKDKTIVVVYNLEPKALMGEESHGMLLAASSDDGHSILTVDKDIKPGSKIS